MVYNILLVKESRAHESRVALTPQDIKILISNGHTVVVENNAGLQAGYNNNAYIDAGAKIINILESELTSYKEIFKNINLLVRVKRPDLRREKLENKAFKPNTIIIGALDPLEPGSDHLSEYKAAKIIAYSIDQADLPPDDPANILSAMSHFAGELALKDAISKCKNKINKVVLLGLGAAGMSALAEALKQNLPIVAIVPNETKKMELERLGATASILSRTMPLEEQQRKISTIISDADIVITSARKPGQKAPLLIPKSTLDILKPHTVLVDLALSEGGNVDGSKHDETIVTDKNVLIVNVSGYPKSMPHEASKLWSKASLHFILRLAKSPSAIGLVPC